MQDIRKKSVIASPDHVYTLSQFKNLRIRKRDLALLYRDSKVTIVSAMLAQTILKNFVSFHWEIREDFISVSTVGGHFRLYETKPIATGISEDGDHFAKYFTHYDGTEDFRSREVYGRLIHVVLP